MKKKFTKMLLYGITLIPFLANAQNNVSDSPAAPSNQFEWAIQQSAVLGLNTKQVNSLRAENALLKDTLTLIQDHLDTLYDFNQGVFESSRMSKILSPAQYSRLLVLRNTPGAQAEAKKRWARAVQKKATGKYTKAEALKQLTAYLITMQSIYDQYRHDTAQNRIAFNELESRTPDSLEILLTADPYRGAEMNCQFAMGLRHQREANITAEQAAGLLAKARELRQIWTLADQHPDSVKSFNTPAFESANMLAILTPQQYEQILTIHNKDNALSQAQWDWQDLTKRKLAGNYNKDSAISALTTYYIARYNTNDHYAHDQVTKNVLLGRLDARQPEVLVALEKARRAGNGQATAGQYVW